MPSYEIEGLVPVVDREAYVHPTAVLIGDVIVGPGCYVGPNAVLRGDYGRVIMEPGSNLQDTCVMHTVPNRDCVVESDGHIGHGAVLHSCRVGRNSLVGMNATLMDDVEIGEESIVGAGAFVKTRFSCPPRSLVAGSPAKVIRPLKDSEVEWKGLGTAVYQRLVGRCHDSLREVEPLTEVEPDRPRLQLEPFTLKKDY